MLYKINWFKDKNKGYILDLIITLLFSLIFVMYFFEHSVKQVFSQDVIDRGGAIDNKLGLDGAPFETRRNPFLNWFPEKPIEINETVEVVENIPRFDISSLSLQGIIWGITDSRAIINDKIYGIGDQINEAKIIKMDKKGVTLQFYEEEYFLPIPETITLEGTNDTITQDVEDAQF